MNFTLENFLKAVGPSASLIFASWIFLTFLQSRYSSSYDRYRNLISEYRQGHPDQKRHHNIKQQIILYKQRCEQMQKATNIGVVSAILLIISLINAGLNEMIGKKIVIEWLSAIFAIFGLIFVIVAASFVIKENVLIQQAIDQEPSDIPDLHQSIQERR
jgi:steroid 5-alpha reductase family enzyme